jgi:hypothetical protein
MQVLICGSRNFIDEAAIAAVIDKLDPDDIVIHGCASGADTIAGELARARGLKVMEFPAQWRRYGRSAGPIRNKQMLVEGKPDIVYAFYKDKKKSKGTKNMVKQARSAGVETVENQ